MVELRHPLKKSRSSKRQERQEAQKELTGVTEVEDTAEDIASSFAFFQRSERKLTANAKLNALRNPIDLGGKAYYGGVEPGEPWWSSWKPAPSSPPGYRDAETLQKVLPEDDE